MIRNLLFLLLLCPPGAWAQPDTLKPIGSELQPGFGGSPYGGDVVRNQYTYDGLDVRRPIQTLGKYILASGDKDAIYHYNKQLAVQKTGGALVASGVVSMLVGGILSLSNQPYADGTFYRVEPAPMRPGWIYSSSPTQQVYDRSRASRNTIGGVIALTGCILTGIGWANQYPGRHFRRSVQYYNRALKQRGITYHLEPYGQGTEGGIRLTGRF